VFTRLRRWLGQDAAIVDTILGDGDIPELAVSFKLSI
jgi:hypothetical protein